MIHSSIGPHARWLNCCFPRYVPIEAISLENFISNLYRFDKNKVKIKICGKISKLITNLSWACQCVPIRCRPWKVALCWGIPTWTVSTARVQPSGSFRQIHPLGWTPWSPIIPMRRLDILTIVVDLLTKNEQKTCKWSTHLSFKSRKCNIEGTTIHSSLI